MESMMGMFAGGDQANLIDNNNDYGNHVGDNNYGGDAGDNSFGGDDY
jgi:hypothetical protein